jgi:hypothetical protein
VNNLKIGYNRTEFAYPPILVSKIPEKELESIGLCNRNKSSNDDAAQNHYEKKMNAIDGKFLHSLPHWKIVLILVNHELILNLGFRKFKFLQPVKLPKRGLSENQLKRQLSS